MLESLIVSCLTRESELNSLLGSEPVKDLLDVKLLVLVYRLTQKLGLESNLNPILNHSSNLSLVLIRGVDNVRPLILISHLIQRSEPSLSSIPD